MKWFNIEGLDGAGKGELIRKLQEHFCRYRIRNTREPGGTPVGEKIREILKFAQDDFHQTLDDKTRILLFNAARVETIKEVVKPALEEGMLVISDRYFFSTPAYCEAENYHIAMMAHLLFINGMMPDVVIYLDVDFETSQARTGTRGLRDDIEEIIYKRFDYARSVYKRLMDSPLPFGLKEPVRISVDTVGKTPEEIFNHVIDSLKTFGVIDEHSRFINDPTR